MTRERLDHRPIWLVGFMGAGKTTIGQALADLLGWDFVDTDALIVSRAGKPIETIFRESGEGRFREIEWEVLSGLQGARRAVVATGGGSFLGVPHRRLLQRTGLVVWLDVPLDAVARRLGEGADRPLWRAADALALRVLWERRRAVYALADVRIEASHGTPHQVAERILDALPR